MLWITSHGTDDDSFLLSSLKTIHGSQFNARISFFEHASKQSELHSVSSHTPLYTCDPRSMATLAGEERDEYLCIVWRNDGNILCFDTGIN
jgi:hypothetical protein